MESPVMIRIDPGVLRWVMDNEGWEVDELAREAGLSALQLRKWVSSESDISLDDIRKMSDKFRRPMSVLFMAEAPDTVIPPQYRKCCGDGQAKPRMSRDMLDVIREARFVQDNAAELLHEMGKSIRPDVRMAAVGRSAEVEAARNAEMLGIKPPQIAEGGAASEEKRYDTIREKIESRNIFVLQDATPARDGASGIALVDPRPAVVLVNSRDPVRSRIFTLLHEYAHVLLGADGVCPANPAPGGAGGVDGHLPRVELWCNRFASAVLMPKSEFNVALNDARRSVGDGDPHRVVSAMSDRFCVSMPAALLRAVEVLDDSGLKSRYARCYEQMEQEAVAPDTKDVEARGAIGDMSPAMLCMARKGRKYARLVSDAGESGIITTRTMLEYLGIKLDCLDDLMIRSGAE